MGICGREVEQVQHLLSMLILGSALAWPARGFAQFIEPREPGGPGFGEARTHRFEFGVRMTAKNGTCKRILATIPVPQEWPEQTVRVVSEELSPQVRKIRERSVAGTATQMLVEIPTLRSGDEAYALRVYEIEKRAILAPEETDQFRIPPNIDRALKRFVGVSPFIEARHSKIRNLSKEILTEAEGSTDWEKVEAIYDRVREKVKYKNGPLKGALQALRDGDGDCEELSSLFIALCRAGKIPARTVWVPDHCYAEFYLEDAEGQGHWFPCQPAGTRAFGEMPEQRPILQKGDNFRVPEKPGKSLRYLSEFLTGSPVRGGGKPQVEFFRKRLE